MILKTYDKEGNPINYRVTKETFTQDKSPEPMQINSYEDFKYMLTMCEEQKQYAAHCRDNRYEAALGALTRSDLERYKEYYKRLEDEWRSGR